MPAAVQLAAPSHVADGRRRLPSQEVESEHDTEESDKLATISRDPQSCRRPGQRHIGDDKMTELLHLLLLLLLLLLFSLSPPLVAMTVEDRQEWMELLSPLRSGSPDQRPRAPDRCDDVKDCLRSGDGVLFVRDQRCVGGAVDDAVRAVGREVAMAS